MSRIFRILPLTIVLLFSLACSLISNPINKVKDTANTAQAIGTQVSDLTTAIPFETLGALPTTISEFGNFFDPQGDPVAEWNGIPIMPQAVAGQEFDPNNYSFKFTGSVQEAVDFYGDALGKAGWSPMITIPGDDQFATLTYQKDNGILTVTITNTDSVDAIVVWFALAQ